MKRNDHGDGCSTRLATKFARLTAPAILAMALVGTAGVALAGENLLLGTWKLKSFVRQDVATGERRPALGERPEGYLGYGPDGRMYVLFVAGGRLVPAGDPPTDAERAQLHKSMLAYAGTYTIAGDKVVHHIDIAWNNARLGSDQVRLFKLDGDRLTLTPSAIRARSTGTKDSACWNLNALSNKRPAALLRSS